MKLLITTGVYPPEIGGPATYTKMLEETLPAHGFVITVLPFSTVRHLPKIIRHVTYFFTCLLKARGVDAIFAQDPVSVGLPSMIVAKLLGKKFFLRLGGDYAWEQGRVRFGVTAPLKEFASVPGRYHPMVHLLRFVQTRVALAARHVMVQSESMKRVVACWGVSPKQIVVIPNGFDATVSMPEKESARTVLNLRGHIGVSAGRLVPWKGMQALIEIVPKILTRVPDFVLYIIGEGPEEAQLRQSVIDTGLSAQVLFMGRLDRTVLFQYLAAADVFILNTTYEGFSNQLLEVYAAGTPIVTTDIEGNEGVVSHGESGLLVSAGDQNALTSAIVEVLHDTTLARRLSLGGRNKLHEFSIERVVSATMKFLI